MILLCGCKTAPFGGTAGAAYQDEKYGSGMRVHTPMVKKDPPTFRCTVCEKERPKPGKVESAKESEKNPRSKLAKAKS